MAQIGFTPLQLYRTSTAATAPTAGNLAAGELAINTTDEKLYFKNAAGVVKLLASSAGSAGDVVGPASATNNALVAFDGVTGKLVKEAQTVTLLQGGTGKTTAPAAMANLMGFTTTATAAGTTTLTNTSSSYQLFTGTTTQTVLLPVTSTLATGWTFHIVNNSTGNVSVQSSGAAAVITVLPGTTAMCTCILITGTTAASWEAGLTDFSTATGTGAVVLATSPTLVTPALGTPASGNFSTGTFTWPTFNQNTTGTAAGLSATLVATSGGTGQSSYAVGDLVYASTTTALSKLADVATGNALISGGVGAAPSYGKIGLTTHVSGTLPVANGGTGITSLGAGVATFLGTPSSANLRTALTDETGTGVAVFGTSPAITTSLTTASTSFDLVNTTATTLNFGGAATTLNIGAATGTMTVGNTTLAAKAITASTTLGVTGLSVLTGGATIQGIKVGKGGGVLATNTAVGDSALVSNTTGIENTAIGNATLLSNTSGDNNTAVGSGALYNNDIGYNNTAVGMAALTENTTAFNNTAVGALALTANTFGYSNTAVGTLALAANDTGSLNVSVGVNTLITNTGGSTNIAVGYNALYSNETGNFNVACGPTALYANTTGSSNTAIGINVLSANTVGATNTGIGFNAGSGITTGSNNIVLGGYTGAAAPISATGSNWVVLSDGNGNVRQAMDATSVQFLTGAVVVYAPTPASFSALATLTNANLQTQIISTTGSGIPFTLTMPTGSTLNTLINWSSVDIGYDFSVINTATPTVTIGVNTGVTNLGALTIAPGTSAQFRIRRTAASTYILYRLS